MGAFVDLSIIPTSKRSILSKFFDIISLIKFLSLIISLNKLIPYLIDSFVLFGDV